jgi:hypothetical protein
MPDRPTSPDRAASTGSREGQTNSRVLAGIALAAVIAVLLLFGSTFNSDQKGVDVTATQPTTTSPTPD